MTRFVNGYRPVGARGTTAVMTLVLAAFASAGLVGAGLHRLALIGRAERGEGVSGGQAEFDTMVTFAAYTAYVLVYAVTGIVFLVWFYRVPHNLAALGADVDRSPSWSVLCYFVPFANLYVPYLCMQEAWRVSGSARDPEKLKRWREARGSLVIVAWWILWVSATLYGMFQRMTQQRADTPELLAAAAKLTIARGCALTIAALLAAGIVAALTDRQDSAGRSAAKAEE